MKYERAYVLRHVLRKKISQADFDAMSALYDKLYDEATEILDKFDPCKFVDGKCMRDFSCCMGCEFLSQRKGCMTRSLACRVWLCDEAREQNPWCAQLLDEIVYKTRVNRFIPLGDRSIKEDVFSHYELEE